MTLNEYFDGVYCLTLPHRKKDRYEDNCLPLFELEKIENVQPIYGVVGNTITLSKNTIDVPIHRYFELGSAMGHLNCIKKAKEDGVKRVLIFEDDIRLIDNVNNKFDEIYEQIPDNYDMLYFGGNHTGGQIRVTNNISRVYRTFALQMYSVHENAYDLIIGYLENCINMCIKNPDKKIKEYESWAGDWFIAKLQPSMNCFSVKPNDNEGRNFSWQMDNNFSDIQRIPTTYEFLKK